MQLSLIVIFNLQQLCPYLSPGEKKTKSSYEFILTNVFSSLSLPFAYKISEYFQI